MNKSSNRVYATTLILLNWKGVFYRKYSLDRYVTALEGNNGAGKTTVMIAAYSVLLPDMKRLRFKNVGTLGTMGNDNGVWGRLGDSNSPSYSAIVFRIKEKFILAGVQFIRKAEPKVELTPFIINGITSDKSFQDLFLLRDEEEEIIPDLDELKENFALKGASLREFKTTKEYFNELFRLGISPRDLRGEEERGQYNELLKTSMNGGISRELLFDLRTFLLKEDNSQRNQLKRMKAEIEACHRTRTEAEETQKLEEDLRNVFEVGEKMFAAAIAATLKKKEELDNALAEAENKLKICEENEEKALQEQKRVEGEIRELKVKISSCESERKKAEQKRLNIKKALEVQREIERLQKERKKKEVLYEQVKQALKRAEKKLFRIKKRLEEAEEQLSEKENQHKKAVSGLVNFQEGLRLLHERIANRREIYRRLATVHNKLKGFSELPFDQNTTSRQMDSLLELVEKKRNNIGQQRRKKKLEKEDAESNKQTFLYVMKAFEEIESVFTHSGIDELQNIFRKTERKPYDVSLLIIDELRGLHSEIEKLPNLVRELNRLKKEKNRKAEIIQTIKETQLIITNSQMFFQVLEEQEKIKNEYNLQIGVQNDIIFTNEREKKDAENRLLKLKNDSLIFNKILRLSTRVEKKDISQLDKEELFTLQTELMEEIQNWTQEIQKKEEEKERFEREIKMLCEEGGLFSSELLELQEKLNAELFAANFEDVSLAEAAKYEAQLGPLAKALVVADINQAIRSEHIQNRSDELSSIWLFPENIDAEEFVSSESLEKTQRDVIIRENNAYRITRIPQKPTLGRVARERHIEELEKKVTNCEIFIREVREEIVILGGKRSDIEEMLKNFEIWNAGDPTDQIRSTEQKITTFEKRLRKAEIALKKAKYAEKICRKNIVLLQKFTSDVHLLDENIDEKITSQNKKIKIAELKKKIWNNNSTELQIIKNDKDALRFHPLSEKELQDVQKQIEILKEKEVRLMEGEEALRHVKKHRNHLSLPDEEALISKKEKSENQLEKQLKIVEKERETAEKERNDAKIEKEKIEENLRKHSDIYREREFEIKTTKEKISLKETELEKTSVSFPTKEMLNEAEIELKRTEDMCFKHKNSLDHEIENRGRCQKTIETEQKSLDKAKKEVEKKRDLREPYEKSWQNLHSLLQEKHLLSILQKPLFLELKKKGSIQLWEEAKKKEHLKTILEQAKDGQELLSLLRSVHSSIEQKQKGEEYLILWLHIQDWFMKRLPSEIAQSLDPKSGLIELTNKLEKLKRKLQKEEQDLRSNAKGTKNKLDNKIREAHRRVKRINRSLGHIQFGSIEQLNVKIDRVKKMQEILNALDDSEEQNLLFQEGIPFDEALERLFERHSSGRSKKQDILDYRKYVTLSIEIKRHEKRKKEKVNPNHLSTGEAIGIGTALMMVILAEWEQETSFRKTIENRLRFLFLDEASRLDAKNLETIFKLCRNLELQLLIAAPEVAKAAGSTVYRLIRKQNTNGKEEVIVSGRRIISSL